ncbi:uncharacterized protein LOC143912983 [Arctopsyche grandis]|uniref:uncharacterized protein LOC143912983 n=1 Tax=Arctopsyche grandis TaxID=121162 RepID=UPI00406D7534
MDVPTEVLVSIFKYLSISDRIAAGQTCSLWYEATRDVYFRKRERIHFTKYNVHRDTFITNMMDSDCCYKKSNYSFKEVDLENVPEQFWQTNGDRIQLLEFEECEMRERMFMRIIELCPNLESLALLNCRELFMSASLLDNVSKKQANNTGLSNLKSLNLSRNRYLSDALLYRFMSNIDYLMDLNLSESPLTFHPGLHRKFYPQGTDQIKNDSPSESILTFPYVMLLLQNKTKFLKRVNLSMTLIDGNALSNLAQLPGLRLESLQLFGCDQLNSNGITAMTQHQTHLTELSLARCSRLTDDLLQTICNSLKSLKYLDVSRCTMITNAGAEEISKLANLEHLSIMESSNVTSEGIKAGVCKWLNPNLMLLNVSALNLDESTIMLVCEMCPNLRTLDLSYCYNAVTDNSVQCIFKNLVHLNTLYMKCCSGVSDAGLTGMGVGKYIASESKPIVNRHAPRFGLEQFQRISLRSKAEEEIVRDAQRKQEVKEMCERNTGDSVQGYSLMRLRNLVSIDLCGCNSITDVSLQYAFASTVLKDLFLSDCQQITYEGLKALVANCPSLESVELVNCFNTRDEGVREMVQGLHRLKSLHLRGCNLITDESIKAIKEHCKSLRFLDVQSCRHVSAELAETLYELPTVHTIKMSKPGPYINEHSEPPAPPKPPKKRNRRT